MRKKTHKRNVSKKVKVVKKMPAPKRTPASKPNIKTPGKKPLSEKELIAMLSPKRGIDLKIRRTFSELPDKCTVLFIEKLSEYGILNIGLAKYFLSKGMDGVYITVNKNLANLIEKFNNEGVDISKLTFIDTITLLSGGEKLAGANFQYIGSPKDLVELSVELENAVKKLGDKNKFVIIDSLSTLLVYNKETSIEKFVHALAAKIRSWNAQGVFILVESTNKEVINTLSQFCDKVITA
tara:strand:- start:5626 stop:6339 length:714 start_codon:yes stop_codon:yes gene_type:complete